MPSQQALIAALVDEEGHVLKPGLLREVGGGLAGLDAGADEWLVSHPQLVPAGHAEHNVDAEAAAALEQINEGVVQLFEVVA